MPGAKPESQRLSREESARAYHNVTDAFAKANGFNCTMEVTAALAPNVDDRAVFIVANYLESVASQIANASNDGLDIGAVQMAMSALAESGFCPPVTIPDVDIHVSASSVADMALQDRFAARSGAGGSTARSISAIANEAGVVLEPEAAAAFAVYAEAVAQELMESAGPSPDEDDINNAVEECTFQEFFQI